MSSKDPINQEIDRLKPSNKARLNQVAAYNLGA